MLALLAALGCARPAWAEAVPPPATPPAPAAFALDIDAPTEIADYLGRHLELQRYRELTDLEDEELRRLLVAAERNARDLLGTLGYFSPVIRLEQSPAAQDQIPQRRVLLQVAPGTPAHISEVRIRFSGPIDNDNDNDDDARAQRAAIRAGWLLRQGDRFTQAGWDDAKAQALRQLTAQRYPAGALRDSLAEVDPETASVRLALTLDSGPLYRLGELAISGSERYDPAMARRLARLAPGADYSQRELLDAQQRLADSGYFDSAFVSLDTTADPAAAPVRVQLREARLQKLVLGIGASTDSGGRLSAEHTHHRLPGLGWRAVSKLALDREKRALGTTLTAPPDAGNWRWMTSALVQHEQAASYTVSSQRLRAGRTQTGERIDRNLYLQFDRARSTGNASSVLADALSANYAWTQRNFDSLPFPADGHGFGVELGGGLTLGSRNEPFARGVLRWLGYWPLARSERSERPLARAGRLVLRAEAGAVLAREGVALPATQLFLTGGDTSVRGYSLHDIGVVQPSGAVAPGRYLAVGSLEWQRPILADNRPGDWEGTVFVDAGAVADKPGALRAKVGVGVGARWKSPVGPLQIDLAYGVDVKRFRLHLNVGFTF
jgi:translocation and assembly module TamA